MEGVNRRKNTHLQDLEKLLTFLGLQDNIFKANLLICDKKEIEVKMIFQNLIFDLSFFSHELLTQTLIYAEISDQLQVRTKTPCNWFLRIEVLS